VVIIPPNYILGGCLVFPDHYNFEKEANKLGLKIFNIDKGFSSQINNAVKQLIMAIFPFYLMDFFGAF